MSRRSGVFDFCCQQPCGCQLLFQVLDHGGLALEVLKKRVLLEAGKVLFQILDARGGPDGPDVGRFGLEGFELF